MTNTGSSNAIIIDREAFITNFLKETSDGEREDINMQIREDAFGPGESRRQEIFLPRTTAEVNDGPEGRWSEWRAMSPEGRERPVHVEL
ncbi:hypothetical protein CesoFtcFv8_005588 [Champsocephalus esox]|uniref:Uncharacterized protein n=1 Tax=Champsocephalus esox TaxID=159716 RepID=A0AAN8CPW9_9TELE|nr:hypothetical protein CesoFtcFv8_005588 [Champsocephalus esox]